MTIYSQHASRGKVQILATYRRDADVISSTVTSVDEPAVAEPIIDALNRVSACATVPVSVSDERTGGYARYPYAHLEAITDRGQRASLRTGSHSLWYEYAKLLLHRALTDLDTAVAAAPPPVRTAIEAELVTEAGGLLAALREYEEGHRDGAAEPERPWDDEPFVLYEGGMRELSTATREGLDQAEEGLSAEQLDQAVADLRLLSDAYRDSAGDYTDLAVDEFVITDDPGPDDSGRYFLDVQAPAPNRTYGPPAWTISISQWDADAGPAEDDDDGAAAGETVLDCELSSRPAEGELATLLTLSGKGGQAQLSAWAQTPAGEALSGTAFVVTQRYDD